MAKNQSDDGIQIAPRCLGIVFKERKPKKHESVGVVDKEQVQVGANDIISKRMCGEELFREFIAENECCYWNPHLQESIKHLRFEGYFHPHTILVTGRDIYLDTVKCAWAQRTIRSPKGFTVHRVGEVCNISMMPIAQSQFTPLPEALCITISDLTKNNEDASFDAIMEELKNRYKGLQQPTEQITYQTLGSLIKERKIYHTGRGYHILSPDLYQPGSNNITVKEHHLVIGGTDTANGMTPMLYIPLVQQANPADMRSISCQTEAKTADVEGQSKADRGDLVTAKKLDKTSSGKEEKRNKRDGFVRSSSLRYGEEKAKNLVKDINLKTSDINQDKDKGEKSSLFSKLFGRNKTKDSGSLKEEDKPDMVEHVTFSAQFPPQELGWCEAQHEHQANARSPLDCHDSIIHRLNTWPDESLCVALDRQDESSVEAVYHEIHNHSADCPMARSLATLPENVFPRSSSHSGSWSSLSELPVKPPHHDHVNGLQPRSHHRRDRMGGRQMMNTGDVHNNAPPDVRPKENHVNGLKLPAKEHTDVRQYKNTFDGPQLLNNATTALSPERPSHVTKVFKKYREMKCTVPCTNDISMEYCGRIQRKNSQLTKSRDSGVNCIGLVNGSHSQMFASLHYNTDVAPLNNHVQSLQNGTEGSLCDLDAPVPPGYYDRNKGTSQRHGENSFSSHKSPEQLGCDDAYPHQDLRRESSGVDTGDVSYNPDHHQHHQHSRHHDSELSIWSDNSRQTVREVRPSNKEVRHGVNRSAAGSHLNWRTYGHDPSLSPQDNGSACVGEEDPSYRGHSRSRSKSPLKSPKDVGEKSLRTKNTNRQSASSGKTLANQVYESHQKVSRQPSGRRTTDIRH